MYTPAFQRPEAKPLSETDSFIHEVSEEVRRDRFYAFLRRWGWLIGLGLVLIVGAAGYNEWRKHKAEEEARMAGDALRAALLVEDAAERAAALDTLAPELGEAAVVARLAQAGSLMETGDITAAADLLAGVASDGSVGPIYRDLASLHRVMLLGEAMEMSERLAALEGLSAEGAPFRPLALEQRALARLEAGETEAALADLEAALADPAAPQGQGDRLRQLIIASGGAMPLGGAPGLPGVTAPAGG